jgi:tetratricopeptide (TPR) repeat protein
MKRILAIATVLVLSTTALAEQPSSDVYDLQVVLRFGAHNWLGQQFRDEVRESLRGMLTDGLGTAANVNVINPKGTPAESWPTLWKEADAKGLSALDGQQELTGVKTHFVFIDYVNGQYVIQARQHDGQTGFVSKWRRETTSDRAFVARIAGKLVAEDFGAVGSVVGRGDKVKVQFKGGAQGAPLERWAQRGDVFALVQVVPGAKEKVFPVPDTLLQLTDDPKGGACTAQVIFRFEKNPMVDAPKGQTFRCIRLGTIQGPVRLHLVDLNGQPHRNLASFQLWIHPTAFQNGPAHEEEAVSADNNGTFVSTKSYDRLAFARIITGGSSIARIPIAIQDGEATVKINLDAKQGVTGEKQAMANDLQKEYEDAILLHFQKVQHLNGLTSKGRNQEALTGYKNARKDAEDSLDRLAKRKDEVKKALEGSQISVAKSDDYEERLQQQKNFYNRAIGQLTAFLQIENTPEKVEARQKLEGLKLKIITAVNSDEYEEAIALLQQATKEYPDKPDFKQQLTKLQDEWKIHNDEHEKARKFIYREWAVVKTSTEIENKLPIARQMLAVLVKEKDYLTIKKLYNSLFEIPNIFRTEFAALGNEDQDTAKEKQERLKKIAEDVEKFSEQVKKAMPAKSSSN